MIFLEYVGSRACLSARLIEYSPVEFILWDFFYDNQSKFLEKVVISFGGTYSGAYPFTFRQLIRV